jgi:hypothetical protein
MVTSLVVVVVMLATVVADVSRTVMPRMSALFAGMLELVPPLASR